MGTAVCGERPATVSKAALLGAATEAERQDREVQLTNLRIAHEWCVRHPATIETGTAAWADALDDLRHRLSLPWSKVEAGDVAPWKTRRVAADTRSLPVEGARWVDEQLAARVDGSARRHDAYDRALTRTGRPSRGVTLAT